MVARVVEPGIHVLSNASLDTPWPKSERGRARFAAACAENAARDPAAFAKALLDDVLHALLEAAGATDIAVHGPVTRTLRTPNAAAYWERFALGAPGTRALLQTLTPAAADALRTRVLATLEKRFGVDGEVALEASAYFATARRLTAFQAAVVAGAERPSETGVQ